MTVKLQELHDVTREMMQAETEQELFQTVTEAASDLLGFEYNTIRRYDEERDCLVPVAVSPNLRDKGGERRAYERGESVQWNAIETGDILVFQTVSDIEDDVERSGSGSMLVVPLAGHGVLTMGGPQPRDIDERDRQLARVFGANIETATDRLEQMQTLEAREAELAEKNERLERFASKVSHELRNPLNVIAGQVSLARNRGDPSHFDDLEQSINRMTKLIDDILAFARRGDVELELERCAIDEIATECWGAVPTQETALRDGASAHVHADRDRLRQLLENLFRNAVEHAGSDVTVTVGVTDDGFYVEDDGRGIPESDREQILALGTAEQSHWTGLGLRIVSQIASAHDWSVAVTESDAGGARFEFSGVDIEQDTVVS